MNFKTRFLVMGLTLAITFVFWRASRETELSRSATPAPSTPQTLVSQRDPRISANPAERSRSSDQQVTSEAQTERRNEAPDAIQDFNRWADAFVKLPAKDRSEHLPEGINKARERLTVLADLVQRDPARLFDYQLPYETRKKLPNEITSLLEQPLSALGDLAVLGSAPQPGGAANLPAIMRTLTVNGEEYQAFTYGNGNRFVTRSDMPVYGLVVPNDAASVPFVTSLGKPSRLIALNESPIRDLGPAETADRVAERAAAAQPDPWCSVSPNLVTAKQEEQIVELAGNLHSFCGKVDLELWRKARIAALGLDTPGIGLASLDLAESSYTEGRKRMLLMRPVWSDYQGGMTTNDALGHWQSFSNYMYEMSYGKLVLAALGKGSDITPAMTLPGTVGQYDNTGLGKLYTTCQDVARGVYGYDLTQYDFLYVCTDGKPAASYCGLAFVGGVGFHLANKCWDSAVSSHEFGHNLGLNHAHFWDTKATSIIGEGQNVEYGDNNDPLGGGGSPNQYNSRYKNYLGWIKDSDIVDLNTAGSGTYRLYAFDLNEGNGVRGLKIRRKDGSLNYWLNFRQRKTDKKALMNGVQLLWTGNGNEGSYLLDVRLKGNADNNAIPIGRTFSDPSINFHLTPVAKGNTYPESIDLVVQSGLVASNLPPTASISASTLTPGAGQTVTFTTTASDPNGDLLAYAWEFGDGDFSVDNQAVTTHSYAEAGEYAAQCVVSDMKGGTSRRTLILTVGAPTTYRISGRVFDARNRPMSGIKLIADASHFAYTDGDGTYSVVNLPAGSYTIQAIEPVAGATTFVHPSFDGPITVGPSAADVDLIGIPGSLIVQTALIPKKATAWKYLDNGTDPGTSWAEPGFNDKSWKTGAAILGYGEGGEATIVSYGPDSNNKYPTTYFRKAFVVKEPLSFNGTTLEVLRDDGVILYLNGKEVFRNNMPAGAVNYQTHALDSVEPDSYLSTSIPSSELLTGTNWIAAEVHQSTPNSSDLTFDLAFSGLSSSNITGLNMVYLKQPADEATFVAPAQVVLESHVSTATTVSKVDFLADGLLLGSVTSAPFEWTWDQPALGTHRLQCVASLGTLLITSPPVRIEIIQPTVEPFSETLIELGSGWRYWSKSTAAPAGWAQTGFNDAGWSNGVAKLGFGHGDEATVIAGGPSSSRYPAAYFRRTFQVLDPAAVEEAVVSLKRDDGVVVYLNGVELFRDNLPSTPIQFNTLATSASDNGTALIAHTVSRSALGLLIPGTNVLAAEVHQSSLTSSDLAFDLKLTTQGALPRERGCWLVSPSAGATLDPTTSLSLSAQVVVGAGLGVSKMTWLVDGVRIAEDTTAPYTATWSNPTPGTHSLQAIAIDSAGVSIPSEPITIHLNSRASGSSLVSFGDTWRYLDDGSDQGVAWSKTTFDDRTWKIGPARLGSGLSGLLTTVNIGTNTAHRNITTYFRRTVVVQDPSQIQSLSLSLVRNDGAAVYLNGVEIWRDNLPARKLSYNTLALEKVSDAGDKPAHLAVVRATGLVAGTNIFAVELHQQSPASTDAAFDLSVVGAGGAAAPTDLLITTPAAGAHFNLPANILLTAETSLSPSLTRVEYFANEVKVAEATVYPYSATWSNMAAGTYTVVAKGIGAPAPVVSPAIQIVVGTAPTPITPVLDRLITSGSPWKYWDSGAVLPETWTTTDFDDSGWSSGNSRLGFGLDGESTTLATGHTTYYFRKTIQVPKAASYQALSFSLVRDDGAVVYLNGTELYRSNMPDGVIRPTTGATTAVDTPEETTFFETVIPITGSGLREGTNVISVEIHQNSSSVNDLAFDLQVVGFGTTEPRITLSAPGKGGRLQAGATAVFNALLQPGSGVLRQVDLLLDGSVLGSDSVAPWNWTWEDAPLGEHVAIARATFADGTTLLSQPLKLTVTPAITSVQLIAPDAVWKYNDKGQNLGTTWRASAYPDSTWASGPARLGYGDDGEATVVGFGPSSTSKYITTYFRHSFEVASDLTLTNLEVRYQRDDGIAVFLNGKELFRNNLAANAAYNSVALSSVGGQDEQTWFSTNLVVAALPAGTNVLAAEVHQSSADSSDLGFALELNASGFSKNTPVPRPKLEAAVLPSGWIQLSWPTSATGYKLQSAATLGGLAGGWTDVTAATTQESGRTLLSLNPTADQQFFRLFAPQ